MSFLELAKQRCSSRSYLDTPVEQEKLDRILEAGRVAPTAANRQPQRVLVVRGKRLDGLKKACNAFHAPLVLIVCADVQQTWTRALDGFQTVDVDASIVTTHMMLEATALKLGSLWIGAFNIPLIREAFPEISEDWVPVNLLAIGYAGQAFSPPDRHNEARFPLGETVFYAD